MTQNTIDYFGKVLPHKLGNAYDVLYAAGEKDLPGYAIWKIATRFQAYSVVIDPEYLEIVASYEDNFGMRNRSSQRFVLDTPARALIARMFLHYVFNIISGDPLPAYVEYSDNDINQTGGPVTI